MTMIVCCLYMYLVSIWIYYTVNWRLLFRNISTHYWQNLIEQNVYLGLWTHIYIGCIKSLTNWFSSVLRWLYENRTVNSIVKSESALEITILVNLLWVLVIVVFSLFMIYTDASDNGIVIWFRIGYTCTISCSTPTVKTNFHFIICYDIDTMPFTIAEVQRLCVQGLYWTPFVQPITWIEKIN